MAFNLMAQQIGESRELLRAENLKRLEAQQEAELAQARAEDRNEQLNAIFALSPDGFIAFDSARCIKYVSPAFTRLTGLTVDELIGLDEAAFSARLASVCKAAASFPGIAALRSAMNPDPDEIAGSSLQVIELIGAGSRVLQVGLRISRAATVSQILYFRDITHETEVDRLKSEFLTTAAHELRTPMASIFGFTELLLTQEFDETDRKEFLSTIYRQSELMIVIINELLDLARIEARSGKDFTLARIDVRHLIHETVVGFKTPQDRSSPQEPPANGPLWVRADRQKLTEAVSNVLSNAYKYSPDGGAVTIELIETSGDNETQPRIGIRITDPGIGMTPEQLARVCERFYRADTSGKIPGTGLGMSIVKEIIEQHGGELQIASQVGAGSAVTLWLLGEPQNILT
jgi:signal transduction histidine kinase